MIKNSSYIDFFPYPTFRSEQEHVIEQIEKAARVKKNILLVAPNGTGKTVTVLSALLPIAYERKLKIVYMCRTHAQSDRVILELNKIYTSNPNSKHSISGLSIRGRNEMCLNNTLLRKKVNPTEAMAICKNLRVGKSCVYYRNIKNKTKGFKDLDQYQFMKPMDAEGLLT
ncbi:MAG: DEAD/DEAH box helicase family protein [Promethearchaeota archaeon]|jgi:Rad3-related DNA helicase